MSATQHILAVGDIHGRLDMLNWLLEELLPTQPASTQLVFLGDYIDRGGQAKEVVDTLIQLQAQRPETVFLMGNHEQMLLDVLDGRDSLGFLLNGGEATLRSYGLDPRQVERIPVEHRRFIASLRLYYDTPEYIFVHAGLRPGLPLNEQSPHDLLWIRDEFFCSDHDFGRKVIFGHTPFPQPIQRPNLIGIDTGAVFGNRLTCLKLPEEKFFSQKN